MYELDHINITVNNLEESIQFYEDVLGFKVIERFKGSMEFVFMSDGNVTYELIQGSNGNFDHIAYVSSNIEQDYKKYKHLATSEIGYLPFLFKNGVKYFFIKGASGERIEFIQKL